MTDVVLNSSNTPNSGAGVSLIYEIHRVQVNRGGGRLLTEKDKGGRQPQDDIKTRTLKKAPVSGLAAERPKV